MTRHITEGLEICSDLDEYDKKWIKIRCFLKKASLCVKKIVTQKRDLHKKYGQGILKNYVYNALKYKKAIH